MATTKKVGRPKKTTTKKKETEEFPVEDIVAEMKGVLITENENTKKKDELKAIKEEERKASFEETETVETVEENIDDPTETMEEETIEPIVEETVEEEKPIEMVEEKVEVVKKNEIASDSIKRKKKQSISITVPDPRKIKNYRQLGQIIDF